MDDEMQEVTDEHSIAEAADQRRSTDGHHPASHELLILLILAAVQFATIIDFMIVMPLGPQLMRTLKINPTEFGLIVSSYTFAAGLSGLIAATIVDRFSRRATFVVLYAGFLLGTLLCGLAPSYIALLAARIATGCFGGILGGMSMTIIGDVFPEERRGRATSSLMIGFALASVAGLPLGLFLGTNYGWHIPFIALALGGLPVLFLAPFALPPLNAHIGEQHAHPLRSLMETFSHVSHWNAFALMVALMLGSFSVFPYVSAYLVANVGMTEQQLPVIYIVGGLLTLIAAPIVGKATDRFGKLRIYRIIAPVSAVLLFTITNLPKVPAAVAVAVFGSLMVSNVGRMIAAMAMITGSVEPKRRGGFLSVNSSVQHIASGLAAYLGGIIVIQTEGGPIERFGIVGAMAALFTLVTLWLAGRVRSAEQAPVTAESLSLAAAAEASVDATEPITAVAEGG